MRMFAGVLLILALSAPASAFMDNARIAALQKELQALPLGERIARWAEEFVGTPYDPDPLGEYVTKKTIVADGRVDCMYHTFRSVELALSLTPAEAVEAALEKRFKTRGVLSGGEVANYDERFQYAMDMLASGKWGTDITRQLASTEQIPGARGFGAVHIIPALLVPEAEKGLTSGDIVFFVKDPQKRAVGEIIGHIGIVKRDESGVWLIHASGRKNRGGEVRKILLGDYTKSMPFVGIKVSRF